MNSVGAVHIRALRWGETMRNWLHDFIGITRHDPKDQVTFDHPKDQATLRLVVGQDVYMLSGCYIKEGKVVKVTPSGVEVRTDVRGNCWRCPITGKMVHKTEEIWRFDSDGKACDSRNTGMFECAPWEQGGIPSTYECGPWEIDEKPYTERRAFFEEKAQKFRKWASMNCEHSKIGEHYYIEKCPICGCENPNYNPITAKKRLQEHPPK